MQQDSRHRHHQLLRSSLDGAEYYGRLALILDRDPYFFPAHLEMLWRAEETGERAVYQSVLRNAFVRALNLFLKKDLQKKLEEEWTSVEVNALGHLLTLVSKKEISLMQRIAARALGLATQNLFELKTRTSPYEARHVKKIKRIDVSKIQHEIAALSPYWWSIHAAPRSVPFHRQSVDTIVLRSLAEESEEYRMEDGEHESVPVCAAMSLPAAHACILSLSKELRIGLGTVVVTRVASQGQIYRRCDFEKHLEGRDRYHLIVSCGPKNTLSSGSETANVREGEVLFFDNKVMHRIHNQSALPSVHIVFDGYPLRETDEL